MDIDPEDLRRRYLELETRELLHLHRTGGLTGPAAAVLQEVLDARDPGWDRRDPLEGDAAWLRSDFESFLRQAATLSLPDEFEELVEPLFVPAGPAGRAISEREIQAAEERIGARFPRGYKRFLQVLGPGCWCRANEVSSPEDVFAFEEPDWELDGFVAIVQNVEGVGDHLAFNPADPESAGERPVYYCAHDPFGYARVADSFETWAREVAAAARQGQDFYRQFDDAVYAKWQEYAASRPKKKKWWHFRS